MEQGLENWPLFGPVASERDILLSELPTSDVPSRKGQLITEPIGRRAPQVTGKLNAQTTNLPTRERQGKLCGTACVRHHFGRHLSAEWRTTRPCGSESASLNSIQTCIRHGCNFFGKLVGQKVIKADGYCARMIKTDRFDVENP